MRRENRTYYFSVEGETEKWYLDWLQGSINANPAAKHTVKLDKAYDRGGYTFVKEKNYFLVGLSIVIRDKIVEYRLKTPIMISSDETLFFNYGIFNTQVELENILETFLNNFIERGNKYITENPIEKFDVFQTCSNSIDPLFEECGFKRIGIENNYFGLVAIYGKSDMEVYIQHNKMVATLAFKVINKKGEELFLDVIMDNYYTPDWRDSIPTFYKNEAEYIELIKKPPFGRLLGSVPF